MKRKGYLVVLFCSMYLICQAQTTDYEIDPLQSTISFSVTHLGALTVTGKFSSFSGNIVTENHKINAIHSTIDVNSIHTGDTKRDQTIKDEAYLYVDRYPHITFSHSAITPKEIIGTLMIKGIQKEIHIPYSYIYTNNTNTIALKLSTSIDRRDFDLDFGAMNMLVGNEIKIEIHLYGT